MVGENILAQGGVVQVTNSKVVPPFFIIEYGLNYVSDLDVGNCFGIIYFLK